MFGQSGQIEHVTFDNGKICDVITACLRNPSIFIQLVHVDRRSFTATLHPRRRALTGRDHASRVFLDVSPLSTLSLLTTSRRDRVRQPHGQRTATPTFNQIAEVVGLLRIRGAWNFTAVERRREDIIVVQTDLGVGGKNFALAEPNKRSQFAARFACRPNADCKPIPACRLLQ